MKNILHSLFQRSDHYRRTLYNLFTARPAFTCWDETGMEYLVNIDNGETRVKIGAAWLPIGGCPFPERLWYAQFVNWTFKNQRSIFRAVLFTLSLWALQAIMWATPGNLFGSVLLDNLIQTLAFWLNSLLIIISSLAGIAIFVGSFKEGLHISMDGVSDTPAALPASTVDIHPDLLVAAQSANENPADFVRRISEAQEIRKHGQWVLVAPFRSAFFLVRAYPAENKVQELTIPRSDNEIFSVSDVDFSAESFDAYTEYLQAFSAKFRTWSEARKLERAEHPLSEFVNQTLLKGALSALSLLIFPALISAQPMTQRAAEYLGEARYTTEAPAGQVLFLFEKDAVYRTGDGVKSYEQLLTESLPGVRFADKDNGALKLVKRGKSVIPREAAQAASGAKLQRVEMSTLQRATASPLMAMDSAETAEALNDITEKSGFYKSAVWRNHIKPLLDFFLSVFEALSILIFGALGMLIVVAITARKNGYLGEEIVGLQRWAARNVYKINALLFCFFEGQLILHMFGNEWTLSEWFPTLIVSLTAGVIWINKVSPDGLFKGRKEAGGDERGLTIRNR